MGRHHRVGRVSVDQLFRAYGMLSETVEEYFKNQRQTRTGAGEERSDDAGEISPYDPLVKKHATMQ